MRRAKTRGAIQGQPRMMSQMIPKSKPRSCTTRSSMARALRCAGRTRKCPAVPV